MNNASKNAPFLSDVNVRKAIYESVDKQSIIDAVFPGAGVTPACSNVPPAWVSHRRSPARRTTWPTPDAARRGLSSPSFRMEPLTTTQDDRSAVVHHVPATRPLDELQSSQGDLQAVRIKSHIETRRPASVVFAPWASTTSTPTKDCEMMRRQLRHRRLCVHLGRQPIQHNDRSTTAPVPDTRPPVTTGPTLALSSPAMDAALKILQTAVDPAAQLTAWLRLQATSRSRGKSDLLPRPSDRCRVQPQLAGYNRVIVGPGTRRMVFQP